MTDRTADVLRRTLAEAADDLPGPSVPPADLRPRIRRRRLARAAAAATLLLVPLGLVSLPSTGRQTGRGGRPGRTPPPRPRQASRVVGMTDPTDEQLMALTADDIGSVGRW